MGAPRPPGRSAPRTSHREAAFDGAALVLEDERGSFFFKDDPRDVVSLCPRACAMLQTHRTDFLGVFSLTLFLPDSTGTKVWVSLFLNYLMS